MPRSFQTSRWWVFALVGLSGLGITGWYAVVHAKPLFGRQSGGGDEAKSAPKVNVDVISPRPGGIDRVCVQPGTVEPFQAADLYAKVSGFLVEQKVDIGSVVHEGDVLARISVPEYEKQVQMDAAEVRRAEARVEQMTEAIATAEADLRAANAAIALAQAEVKSKTSYRAYREKERGRINELAAKKAIEPRVMDEQEDQYQAAIAAELAAGEVVNAARQKEMAARARVKQAQADLKYSGAEVVVAKARLEKSEVLLDYTLIKSPYVGVVTRRNFQPGEKGQLGDFIRSADAGGDRVPVLRVERTDVMRVVVQVPDRDVPYVKPGNPAIVEIDALPGEPFRTTGENKVEVSRSASSEDTHTRMMRTEVDVKNPGGKLRRGMYGRVTLNLKPGSPQAVRIPSSAMVGKAENGKASVRVVRGDTVHLVAVRYGIDTGTEVEILSGLSSADRVVIRANAPVDDGTAVTVTEIPPRSIAH